MRVLTGMLLLFCALATAHTAARAQEPATAPSTQGPPAAPSTQAARAFEDPNAPAGWKRYELQFGAGSVMSVFLPSLSEVMASPVPMGAAGTATSYIYTSGTETEVYVLAYLAGVPPEATDAPEERAALFESFWRGFAAGIRNSLQEKGVEAEVVARPPKKVTVSGLEAQEQEFSIGQMPGTVRAVIAGGYAYSVVAVSLDERPRDEYKRFINSFSLRARR